MAKNFTQKGDVHSAPAAVATESGEVVVIGDMIGVALNDAAIGDMLDTALTGVFELPCETGAISVGAPVYVTSAGVISGTASGNTAAGHAFTAAGAGVTSIEVRLLG